MDDPLTPDPSHGVFETLLVVDGRPVELAAHLERLRASVDRLYGTALPDDAERLAAEGARGLEHGRLRVTVSPSREPEGVGIDVRTAAIDATIVFPAWEQGLELRTQTIAGWRGAHKWADRRWLEALDVDASPAAALLVDEDGSVLETTRANVFIARADGKLATPPADGRILPGIARMRALEIAREIGIEATEADVAGADLSSAREVFATGSVRGVEPVRSIDGAPTGRPQPSLTETIATALRERWLPTARASR